MNALNNLAETGEKPAATWPGVQESATRLSIYYLEDLRLREIAEAMGVTESRVCQIHAQALLSLKTYLRRREVQAACHRHNAS